MGAQPRGGPAGDRDLPRPARDVVARPATDAEAEEVFALAATFYVGYRNYRQRVGERRRIRVFVLEPAG